MSIRRLNIGDKDFSGIYTEEEWLTIDVSPRGKSSHLDKFMVMSVLEMPSDWTDRYKEIHMIHCLEHINRNERQRVVKELHRVLAPGGTAYVEVPDFRQTVHLLNKAFEQDDAKSAHIWTTSIYGKQRFPGDQHCWGFTRHTLEELFVEAGFKSYQIGSAGPDYAIGEVNMISSHYKQEPVLLVRGVK